MAVYHERDRKKPSGGKRRYNYKAKKRALSGRYFVPTILASEEKEERKKLRVRGGGFKLRLNKAVYANVIDKKAGTAFRAKVLEVSETPANREYKRRNIITKGTVIETEKGLAVVVSRPGQEGVINAVLVS
ncbi:MAG: 30S ribosomal protein S8e [Desulfurococcales archaeon]|nr:30S ribosomal protein S8e [Desulfurococcales archaeon]